MRNRSKSKGFFSFCMLWLLLMAAILTLDYLNIPSRIGMSIGNINNDVLGIVIGNGIVVFLYVLTYMLIDSKSIKKEINKRKTSLALLQSTNKACTEMISIFDDSLSRTIAAKKCDFDAVIYNDKQLLFYLERPFLHDDTITEFAVEGILSSEEYSSYLLRRDAYQSYVTLAVTFFDKYELATDHRDKIKELIFDSNSIIKKEQEHDHHRKAL